MKYLALIVTFLFLYFQETVLAANSNFTFFNAIRYTNTPSNAPYLSSLLLSSQDELLSTYVTTNPLPTDNQPNYTAVKSFAQSALAQPVLPVTLDIEVWPYWPAATLNTTIQNLIAVVDSFKLCNPDSKIGYYGVVPKQAYKWSSIDPISNPSGYESWNSINNSMKPVADKVDLFFPSFYAYDLDTTSWLKMVDSTIQVTKRYSSTKPIYAYLCPQYHDGSAYSNQFIDSARWNFMLEKMYERIDGCVLWTSNLDQNNEIISWDSNRTWWQATKAFMVTKALVPPLVMDNFRVITSMPTVQLQWTTSVDTISSQFMVQRSSDSLTFTTISEPMLKSGSNYTMNHYSFTDTLSTSGKVYYRLQISDMHQVVSYSSIISHSSSLSAFVGQNIVVLRIGGPNEDGTSSGNPASAGSAVHLDEIDSNTGSLIRRKDLPTENLGTNHPFYLSSAASEGLLTLSPNGQYLTAFGYAAKTTGSIYNNTASVSPRTVAIIKGDGTINTSTALSDFAVTATGATTGNAITNNGTDLWMAASNSTGIAYSTLGSAAGATYVVTANGSNRSVGIYQNELYVVSGGGIRLGKVTSGEGLPKTTGATFSALNVSGNGISTASPNQLLLLDMNATIPGADVLYVTNSATTGNTLGILKYSKDASGQWQPNGGFGNTMTDSIYLGITGVVSGSCVNLYVTSGIKTGNYPGKLIKLTDASGHNGSMNGQVQWSVPAPKGSTYRGVAFTPTPSFTYVGSGDLNQLSNWSANENGSGVKPASFTDANQTFFITRGNPTLNSAWSLPGNHSRIVIGDGLTPIVLTVSAKIPLAAKIEIQNNATLNCE